MDVPPWVYTTSATKLCQLIREGKLRSSELLEAFIAKVESESHINAVVVKHYAAARSRAAAADQCWIKSTGSQLWGRLHGLPMTVKEELTVEGIRGLQVDGQEEDVPTASCAAVQRLIDEGAIIFGKTNVPARCKDWQTFNNTFGPTANPHDCQRTCGGSSGGSCVAVACGHTPVELGGDVAGSIRIPAAFCGVFGMQGTYGRVPTSFWNEPLHNWLGKNKQGASDGLKTLCAPMMDLSSANLIDPHVFKVIGPICKFAEDLALLNSVLERQTGIVSEVSEKQRSPTSPPPKQFRLTFLSEMCPNRPEPLEPALSDAVRASFHSLQEKLKQYSGSNTSSVVVPLRAAFPEDFADISYSLYRQILANKETAFHPDVMIRRQWCRTVWNAFFDANGVDAVLMPISPTLPFLRNEVVGTDAYTPERFVWTNDSVGKPAEPRSYADFFYWPHFSILAQLPSVSVPCGSIELPNLHVSCYSSSGDGVQPIVAMDSPSSRQTEKRSGHKLCKVPIGFQLVSRPHADAWLVSMAEEIKRVSEA